MHKIVVLYPPQPDPAAFKAYYVETHIPLVRKLPGLLALRYSFDVQGVGGEAPYFCVFEGDFADQAAFFASVGSEIGGKVAADVGNYDTGGSVMLHYAPTEG